MKHAKILLGAVLLFLLVFGSTEVCAQYNLAAGVRLGGTTGLSAKYFYRPGIAAEGIIGGFGNGFSITALIEKYAPVYNTPGLSVYYGGGAHVAFYNTRNGPYGSFGRDIDYRKNNDVGFALNGIVGIEYRLPDNFPLALTVDLKPFIEVGSGGNVAAAMDPSFGIRFIIR